MEDRSERFLDIASTDEKGRRYFISLLCIWGVWQVLGSLPYSVFYLLGWTKNIFMNYIGVSLSFIALILAIRWFIPLFHHRSWRSLISPDGTFSAKRFFTAFGLWMLIAILTSLADAWIHPGSYQFTLEWPAWLWFTLLAVVLTPLQTSAEEMFFRGYLLQILGRLTRKKWLLLLLSGILFAVPHFVNPEMHSGFVLLAVFYFGFGVFLTWLTLYDNRLELALGVHAANNLFAVIGANYVGSALPSFSLFLSSGVDPWFNLISFLIDTAVFLLLLHLVDARQAAA